MKLSEHFERREFACKCGCGLDTVDHQLVQVLELVRAHFGGRPITVNSGHRCRAHNAAIGGSPNSQHLHGRAADIVITGVSPDNVADFLEGLYRHHYGVGRYNSFTHFDTRTNGPARWDNRS